MARCTNRCWPDCGRSGRSRATRRSFCRLDERILATIGSGARGFSRFVGARCRGVAASRCRLVTYDLSPARKLDSRRQNESILSSRSAGNRARPRARRESQPTKQTFVLSHSVRRAVPSPSPELLFQSRGDADRAGSESQRLPANHRSRFQRAIVAGPRRSGARSTEQGVTTVLDSLLSAPCFLRASHAIADCTIVYMRFYHTMAAGSIAELATLSASKPRSLTQRR